MKSKKSQVKIRGHFFFLGIKVSMWFAWVRNFADDYVLIWFYCFWSQLKLHQSKFFRKNNANLCRAIFLMIFFYKNWIPLISIFCFWSHYVTTILWSYWRAMLNQDSSSSSITMLLKNLRKIHCLMLQKTNFNEDQILEWFYC